MQGLAGKVALVTGASSGIGRAIAFGLAAQGAALGLVGRDSGRLKAIADQIGFKAAPVVNYSLDLTSVGAASGLLEKVNLDFGRLHILVHSAGVFARGSVGSASVADLDWQYQVNVRLPYTLTQTFLPLLKTNQGDIIFINSSAGLAGRSEVGQYAATKHALKAISDSLREEVNPDGVRVTSLFVGRTATPMQAQVHHMEGRQYKPERLIQPEDIAALVVNALNLPRSAEVTEISIRPHLKLS